MLWLIYHANIVKKSNASALSAAIFIGFEYLHANVCLPDIVQHGSDEKRIISAMWAKDEDISRFLRYVTCLRLSAVSCISMPYVQILF